MYFITSKLLQRESHTTGGGKKKEKKKDHYYVNMTARKANQTTLYTFYEVKIKIK